jgi:preprotein translocase subunit Sss1
MPTHNIQVIEYECTKCNYRWINRVNGKEQPKPKRCARCKRPGWDEGWMSDEEKRLRRLLMLETQYTDTCHRFLNISPRPTKEEIFSVHAVEKELQRELKQEGVKLEIPKYNKILDDAYNRRMQEIIDSRR